jgi:predicted nucleic acid-binding protein
MSRFLLDTNVISELRRHQPHPRVQEWRRKTPPHSFYLSILTFAEIAKGIAQIEDEDPRQAAELEAWRIELYEEYTELHRLLPITIEIADQWGKFFATRPMPIIDGFLAATALVHNFTLVTRNERDFKDLGVRILNPFTAP